MPERKKNSYDECSRQISARFEGRGVALNTTTEVQKQIKNENSEPNAVFVARKNSDRVPEAYQNGQFGGRRFMTTGDFLEYYKNQKEPNYMQQTPKSAAAQTREFKSTPPVRRSETEATGRSAAGNGMRPARPVKKFDPKADTIVMPAQKPTGIKRKLSAIVGRWFPAEDREDRKEKTTVFKRDLPVAVIGLMAALSVAMTMIIGSGVMVSEASMEVSELKSDISVLENECDKLNEELTKKENLAEIQAYAENGLGMISKNYAASEYIEIAGGNSVQDYSEDEKPIVGFGTLLNAIFGE